MSSMPYLNIAGYHFTPIEHPAHLRADLLSQCNVLNLKGSILLSPEGINLSMAGEIAQVRHFQAYLKSLLGFESLGFHESYSDFIPFKRLKVKLKKEIITLRQADTTPTSTTRGGALSPDALKQWLDEGRDITLLDTRNDYEVELGTFKSAHNPHIRHFTELHDAVNDLDKSKPVVMFCTGGIRCEKASLMMTHQGFEEVYQLDGGILGYFAKVGGAHYEGRCFVFDERVALDSSLNY